MLAAQLSIFTGGEEAPVAGVDALNAIISGEAEYFAPNGRRITRLQPGVNIIRYANGKTTKVFIK